jgi:putative addiction module killer protein
MELKQTETFRLWETKLKDRRARTVIASRLMRLSEGLIGDAPSVGDGVRELRIHYGPGYRVYFQQRGSTLLLFYCAVAIRAVSRAILLQPRSWH